MPRLSAAAARTLHSVTEPRRISSTVASAFFFVPSSMAMPLFRR
uniref:Uncharacterized protein n=1 Tax=Arundo donax TaxID=35708 RepID=A0A0A9BG67_ARUDO